MRKYDVFILVQNSFETINVANLMFTEDMDVHWLGN